jgi:ubiquinone/menaquinone biosynthesis C-methylase UbiE
MNYKIKNCMQQLFSALPKSNYLNRLFQIYISRSLPISNSDLEARQNIAARHIENYKLVNHSIPHSLLDVGAGSDLALPIIFGKLGVQKIVGSDIYPLATPFLINDILKRLDANSLEDLNVSYVTYEGKNMPFIENEFDFITTTSVLEHVPEVQISNLVMEMYRCLKENGIASHYIAHIDHWSHTDSRIHPMNYLRYSDVEWRKYNPSLNYQSRLLQSDYSKIFEDCGFEILNVTSNKCEMPNFKIDSKFDQYSIEDLTTTHSWYELKKARYSKNNYSCFE